VRSYGELSGAENYLLWCGWWVGLGILSSVGLGTGLHTFLLYLGQSPLFFLISIADPHRLYADPDLPFHFDANPTFHFNANPDPPFHFDADRIQLFNCLLILMRIRIRLFTLMRFRTRITGSCDCLPYRTVPTYFFVLKTSLPHLELVWIGIQSTFYRLMDLSSRKKIWPWII
jgi:hypothetical protein